MPPSHTATRVVLAVLCVVTALLLLGGGLLVGGSVADRIVTGVRERVSPAASPPPTR